MQNIFLVLKSFIKFRLTGTYAFCIFFIATVYRYMEYGPMHFQSYYYSEECRDSPWRQLLYINNFKNAKDVS